MNMTNIWSYVILLLSIQNNQKKKKEKHAISYDVWNLQLNIININTILFDHITF